MAGSAAGDEDSAPVRRDVPETVVSPTSEDGHAQGLTTLGAISTGDRDVVELVNDIRNLVAEGLADQEIAERLDLTEAAIPIVAYLRQRGDEPL